MSTGRSGGGRVGPRWTTPEDVAARVRRRWDDGSLLRSYAAGAAFAPIEVPLRGPRATEIGDDLGAVRDWISGLDAGRRGDSRYALAWASVGGRAIGRNELPVRAIVSSYAQAWALLGVGRDVRRFDGLLSAAGERAAVRAWLVAHPLRSLTLEADLPRIVAAYDWLDDNRGSGRYLREISAPGVDTKFAEQHRGVLAAMLGVSSTATGFLAGLGLRAKPELVRLRPSPSLDWSLQPPGRQSPPLSEVAIRADELVGVVAAPRVALIVENEITYLSVPVPQSGIVLWGKGFDIDRVGRLPWLADVDVVYWGDLDTHGFAILDRLRAWLPQTRSVLMDRETLLAHRDRWVTEDRPTSATLRRLTPLEADLYADLVRDALGDRVRLEQERIDWSWAAPRLRTVRAG